MTVRFTLTAALLAAAVTAPVAQSATSDWAASAVTRLAIETAADVPTTPLEMEMQGRVIVGVYDRFRLAALAARAAAAAGQPLDPSAPPASVSQARTIVIAFAGSPLPDGVPAQSIEIVGRDGRAIKRAAFLKAHEVAELLPGVTIPGSALVALFNVASLKPGDRIKLQSASTRMSIGINPGSPRQIVAGPSDLAVNFTVPEEQTTPSAQIPAGVSLPPGGAAVTIEGVLDLSGRVRYARVVRGPENLRQAALDAVAQWRYTPAKMWQSPVPLVMQAVVAFR